MAVMHVAVDLVLLATVSPLLAWVARWLVVREERAAISNADLIGFFLSPAGLTLAVLAGVGLFASRFAQLAGILAVVGDEGRLVRRLGRVVMAWPRLAWLAAWLVVILGGLMLPGLLVAAASAWPVVMGELDVNYYLARRPPVFWWSAVGVAIGLLVAAVGGLIGVARLCLTLPIVLFERAAPRAALVQSWRLTGGRAGRIGGLLIGFAIGAAIISVVAGIVAAGLVGLASFAGTSRLAIALFLLAAALQATVAEAISFVIVAWFGTLLALLFGRNVEPVEPIVRLRLLRWRNGLAVWLAGLVVILVALGTTLAAGVRALPEQSPLIISHRGDVADAPENSRLAFGDALAAGADVVELDVQLSADGVPIVAHDADLMRVAGSPRKIADTTADQLAEIALLGPGNQTLPTLRRALQDVTPTARVLIELKYYGFDDQLAPAVVAVVDELGVRDRVLIMSLESRGVVQARALAPDVPVGLTVATSLGDLAELDVDFIALGQTAADPRTLDRLHARGIEVYVWTVNDVADLRRCLAFGVEGIITDDVTQTGATSQAFAEATAIEQALTAFRARWLH